MALEPLFPAEENNEVSWYTSGLAGIASGGIKVVEGAFSLGAELIDLGFDTNSAANVEMFFDKLNPLEEYAEQTGIGKLTQALVQIGVPGTAGFKLANQAARNLTSRTLKAKRANAFADFKLDKDRVVSETIWRCNYCNEPVVFESKELAMAHTDYCIYNEENSSCFLCEHLKVIQHTEYEPHITNKLNNVNFRII